MLVTNSKNNAGGEQTDLQNQPTRRNGPNQHRAHTQTPQHITEGHGGRIRDRWGLVGDRKETTKLVDRTQFKQKRCRDGCQVVPQWHKQLFKFQRIRCTTCSTSPETKKTHLQEKEMPVACCRTCHVELRTLELQWQKLSFWLFKFASGVKRWSFQWIPRDGRTSGTSQKGWWMERPSVALYLDRWIIKLKCVNLKVKSVLSHPKKGCLKWSHHGNHTRQNWIF